MTSNAMAPDMHLRTTPEHVEDSEGKAADNSSTSRECNTDLFQIDQSLPEHNTEIPMLARHGVLQVLPHDAQLDTQTHAAQPPNL